MKQFDKLAIATTVRAEASIIIQFIDYHLSKKFDEIFIFLDDPDFNTIPLQFINHDKVKFIFCDDKYWTEVNNIRFDDCKKNIRPKGIEQRQFSNYAYTRQLTHCDWVANIDIDELIYSSYEIKSFISQLPLNIFSVRMRTKEAIYTEIVEDDQIFNTYFFKKNNKKAEKSAQLFFDSKLHANGGYWGHKLGKILARKYEGVRHIGNHYLFPLNSELITDIEFDFLFLLHFEGMSKKYFIEKQLRRLKQEVVVQRLATNEIRRLDYFKTQFLENGEVALLDLYKEMHFFDKERLKLALDADFVEKINFMQEPKDYQISLVDFHHNVLKFDIEQEKISSLINSNYLPLYCLKFKVHDTYKCILYSRGENNRFISFASNGTYLKPNFSFLTKIYQMIIKDGFFVIHDQDSFLISLKNGQVKFNSKNLGDWELFELL